MIHRIFPAVFLFASLAVAQEEQVFRVYAIGDFVREPGSALRTWDEPEFGLLGPWPRHQEIPETIWHEAEPPSARDVASVLTDLLTEIAGGGRIDRDQSNRHLLVWASGEQHSLIARTLTLLREQGDATFEIEVRHVSVPAAKANAGLHEAVGDWDGDLASLVKLDPQGRSGTITAPPGQWTSYRSTRKFRYVPDFDVEIAQASAIDDPVAAWAHEGLSVAVRPFLLQDGSTLLRVVAAAGDLDEAMRRVRVGTQDLAWVQRTMSAGGELELLDFDGCAVATETIVATDRPLCLFVSAPDGRIEALELTVRRAPEPAEAGTFAVLPTGGLTAPDRDRFLVWRDGDAELLLGAADDGTCWLGDDSIVEWSRGRLEGEKGFLYPLDLHGGSLVVRATDAACQRIIANLALLERELLHPRRVTVRLQTAGDVVGVLNLPVLEGRRACATAYRRRDHVADYDVEVAQESRISDPKVYGAYAGLFANVILSHRGPRAYRLNLDLRVALFTDGIRNVTHSSGEFGTLESVPTDVRDLAAVVDLERGESHSLDLGPLGRFGPVRAVITVE